MLGGCGGGTDSSPDTAGAAHDAFDAATGSLEDLNLKRREIPEFLQKISTNPYAPPGNVKCPALREEITQLDKILGPDVKIREGESASVDAYADMANIELPAAAEIVAQGQDYAHSTAMNFIRAQTSIIPFRSIVRGITGADRHAKKVALAYQAGQLRRAYLKGLAQERFGSHCLAPPIVLEAKIQTAP